MAQSMTMGSIDSTTVLIIFPSSIGIKFSLVVAKIPHMKMDNDDAFYFSKPKIIFIFLVGF